MNRRSNALFKKRDMFNSHNTPAKSNIIDRTIPYDGNRGIEYDGDLNNKK